MKITISNLGPIREKAEIDLKPLTVLIGPNNAGKTWIAYTLAAIFSQRGWIEYTRGDRKEEVAREYPPIIDAVDKIFAEGTATIDLVEFANDFGEMYFNNIALYAREWLAEFMNTRLVQFDNLELCVDLAEIKADFLDQVLNAGLDMEMGVGISAGKRQPLLRVRKKPGQTNAFLYTFAEGEIEGKFPREEIEARLASGILRILHGALYPNVVTLPTERTAFITFPFNALTDHFNKRMTSDIDKDSLQGIRLMNGPVRDFFFLALRTSEWGSKQMATRRKNVKYDPTIEEYDRLAQLLEKQILGGEVTFSEQEPDPKREILFIPSESTISLEIPVTSSMVKELTPLVFYLRYFAHSGNLLIIDEPEMNLHPEAQAKLIEFLAMLANAGLRVLITTHSPYMVDHLANLIAADKCTDRDAASSQFFLKDSSAFIPQEKVAAYKVEQGKIENILDEDGILNWGTFGNLR